MYSTLAFVILSNGIFLLEFLLMLWHAGRESVSSDRQVHVSFTEILELSGPQANVFPIFQLEDGDSTWGPPACKYCAVPLSYGPFLLFILISLHILIAGAISQVDGHIVSR